MSHFYHLRTTQKSILVHCLLFDGLVLLSSFTSFWVSKYFKLRTWCYNVLESHPLLHLPGTLYASASSIPWNLGRGDGKDNGSSFHSLVDYWEVWRVMSIPTRELTIRDLQSAHSTPTDRAGDPSWAPLSLSQGCNTEFRRELLPSGLGHESTFTCTVTMVEWQQLYFPHGHHGMRTESVKSGLRNKGR